MMPTAQMPRRDVTGARIGAWFIDIIILGALAMAITIGMGGWDTHTWRDRDLAVAHCERFEEDNFGSCSVDMETDFESRRFGTWDTTEVRWVPNLLLLAISLGAYPLLQGLTGATPGKALVGLRVVQRNGQICGVGRSFLRHILWVADSIICGLPVVGGAVMLSTQHKQRVGDLAASTFVVHRSEVGTAIQDQVWGAVAPPPMAPGPYGVSGHPGFQPGSGAHGWAPPPVPQAPSDPAPSSWGQGAGSNPGSGSGSTDGPTWDAARGTYVQYDPSLGAWMQWNDITKAWEPIR